MPLKWTQFQIFLILWYNLSTVANENAETFTDSFSSDNVFKIYFRQTYLFDGSNILNFYSIEQCVLNILATKNII